MKRLIVMLAAVSLAAGALHAQNLLFNGDFSLGENKPEDPTQPNTLNAVGWSYWNGGGWNNREINANGLTPDNYHMALGNSGATDQGLYQVVPAMSGLSYRLSVDAGSPDSWWKPNGEVKMEFLAADSSVLGSAYTHWAMPAYDVLLPWQNYFVTAIAPEGTTQIKALLMNQGTDGGTMRFDNAVLIPEPTTMVLSVLGLALLLGCRSRRDTACG